MDFKKTLLIVWQRFHVASIISQQIRYKASIIKKRAGVARKLKVSRRTPADKGS